MMLRIILSCALLFGLAASSCNIATCTPKITDKAQYCACVKTEISGCTTSTLDAALKTALEASQTALKCGGSQLTTNMMFLTMAAVVAWALNFR